MPVVALNAGFAHGDGELRPADHFAQHAGSDFVIFLFREGRNIGEVRRDLRWASRIH